MSEKSHAHIHQMMEEEAMTTPTPPTEDEILEMERLAEAATPGPWTPKEWPQDYGDSEWSCLYPDGEDSSVMDEHDARFIAAARNFILPAIAALRAKDAEIAGLTKERDEACKHLGDLYRAGLLDGCV